jgi:hypothetical protein
MIDHHISWTTIFFMIIQQIFFPIDDYISQVTIFFTSKFGENSTITKITGAKVLYPRITEGSKKFPLFFSTTDLTDSRSIFFIYLFLYFSTFAMLSHW